MSADLTGVVGAGATTAWDGGILVVTRVFDAPREAVYRAWTDPEQFASWFGPHGSTMPDCKMDVRPGGVLHFRHRHHFTEIEDVWVSGVYREVVAPERITFDFHFSDEEGNRVDRPGFPQDTQVAVSFVDLDGMTRVTIRHSGLIVDQGEVQGWIEGLDRLQELLVRA